MAHLNFSTPDYSNQPQDSLAVSDNWSRLAMVFLAARGQDNRDKYMSEQPSAEHLQFIAFDIFQRLAETARLLYGAKKEGKNPHKLLVELFEAAGQELQRKQHYQLEAENAAGILAAQQQLRQIASEIDRNPNLSGAQLPQLVIAALPALRLGKNDDKAELSALQTKADHLLMGKAEPLALPPAEPGLELPAPQMLASHKMRRP